MSSRRPVVLHTFGGLAGQLSGLAHGLWIADHVGRPVCIHFHDGGVSHRPLVIEDLLGTESVRDRVTFQVIEDFVHPPKGNGSELASNLNQRSTGRKVASVVKTRVATTKNSIETRLGIRITQKHLDRDSLRRVKRWTQAVHGYPTDWNVVDDVIDDMRRAITETGRSNFLLHAGSHESIAIHWRLGDYVSHKGVNEFHGVISLESILRAVHEVDDGSSLPVTIFTDSPEVAAKSLSRLSNSRQIEIKSGTIWGDIFEMTRSKYFIGSHSGVSMWVATAIRSNNPDALTLLPDRWFVTDYAGFDLSTQVEGRFSTSPVDFTNP